MNNYQKKAQKQGASKKNPKEKAAINMWENGL